MLLRDGFEPGSATTPTKAPTLSLSTLPASRLPALFVPRIPFTFVYPPQDKKVGSERKRARGKKKAKPAKLPVSFVCVCPFVTQSRNMDIGWATSKAPCASLYCTPYIIKKREWAKRVVPNVAISCMSLINNCIFSTTLSAKKSSLFVFHRQ